MRALSSLLFAIAAASRRRPRLSAQGGSMLVEVMVGAIVLAIATTAVLSGLEGAQDTGLANKSRTEYATLAQQDIERLRSMPIYAISDLDETRTVDVGGVDYTVHSETEWLVDDPTGIASCTEYNPLAEYLKVTSTVSSPAAEGTATPVRETTLLTPAPGSFGDTGTATVRVTDRDGNPREGLSVTLSGPGAYLETTNVHGCAIFRYITPGAYTAEVSGGVSWSSELPATAPVTVNAGKTTFNPIEVDVPASLRAHFKTPAGVATDWSRVSVAHAKLPAGYKAFPDETATTRLSSIDATNLFPHKDAYGVFAGSCASNNPSVWKPDYFQPGVPGYVVLDRGDNLVDVEVTMPTLTIDFWKSSSSTTYYHMMIKQVDGPDCTENVWDYRYPETGGTTETNRRFTFQLPFGRYKVCVDNGSRFRQSASGSSNSDYPSPPDDDESSTGLTPHRMMPPNPDTSSKNGAMEQTDRVDLSSGGTSGTCPRSGW